MRPIQASVGPLAAASVNAIALTQTPTGASNLILNGASASKGVATLDNPRRVLITTTDTTHVFTVTGTTPAGAVITESGLAVAGIFATLQDFKTVTAVSVNGTPTAAVQVGTNGVASTPWVRLDDWADGDVGIQVDVTGTVNYTVQSTMDDPNDPFIPVPLVLVNWIPSSDAAVVAATTSQQSNFEFSPVFARVLLNSGSGSISAIFRQSSAVPY